MNKLTSAVVRFFYPYGSERTILLGPLRGWRYVVERDNGFSYALGKGLNLHFFSRQIKPGMVLYDIGANRGQLTLLFSRAVGESGRVYAFEPAPIPFQTLERHIALNRLTNVQTCQAAVADNKGVTVFTYFEDHPSQGSLSSLLAQEQRSAGKTMEVACVSLDGILESGARTPDMLKIDVEGSAAGVLRGAHHLLELAAPSIYIELHNDEEKVAVRDELLSRRYTLQTLDGQVVSDPTAGWFSPLWCRRVGER